MYLTFLVKPHDKITTKDISLFPKKLSCISRDTFHSAYLPEVDIDCRSTPSIIRTVELNMLKCPGNDIKATTDRSEENFRSPRPLTPTHINKPSKSSHCQQIM